MLTLIAYFFHVSTMINGEMWKVSEYSTSSNSSIRITPGVIKITDNTCNTLTNSINLIIIENMQTNLYFLTSINIACYA